MSKFPRWFVSNAGVLIRLDDDSTMFISDGFNMYQSAISNPFNVLTKWLTRGTVRELTAEEAGDLLKKPARD